MFVVIFIRGFLFFLGRKPTPQSPEDGVQVVSPAGSLFFGQPLGAGRLQLQHLESCTVCTLTPLIQTFESLCMRGIQGKFGMCAQWTWDHWLGPDKAAYAAVQGSRPTQNGP